MERHLKPPRVSILVRASAFALMALVAARQPFNVIDELSRERLKPPPGWFWPAVWTSAAVVVVLGAFLAWRIAREAFPPKGTFVFPVIDPGRLTVIDLLTTPFAALFLLVVALLPSMFLSPMGTYGMREMDVMQVLILGPMGAALLLWRPTFHITRGQPVVRYPAGGWLPWKKALPMAVQLEWRDAWAGKPRRQVGWSLHGTLPPRFEFELDFVGLNATQEDQRAVEATWREFFGRVEVGTPTQQRASVADDKPVKPWHLMAAMFGLPGFAVSLAAASQHHASVGSAVMSVGFALVTGALTVWFASRFVPKQATVVLASVLALLAVGLAWRGHGAGEAEARGRRIGLALQNVCRGSPSPFPVEPDAPELGWAFYDRTRWQLLGDGTDAPPLAVVPRRMMCLRHSTSAIETRALMVRGRRETVERQQRLVRIE